MSVVEMTPDEIVLHKEIHKLRAELETKRHELAQRDRAIKALHRHCGCKVCKGILQSASTGEGMAEK